MDCLLPSVAEIRSLDESQSLTPSLTAYGLAANTPTCVRNMVGRLGLDCYPIEFDIELVTDSVPGIGHSYAYCLTVDEQGVSVHASTEWGALAACTTIKKLGWRGKLPFCHLIDKEAYPWRGLMVDTCRHFMPIRILEETLDLMSHFQLNVLHLGLSNDQACRFYSQSAPRLASTEHYAASELRSLVDYASERGIRVVPELDVPGHTTSWVWAYPEWGAGKLDSPSKGFGVHQACLDPTRPEVMNAVKSVFTDLAEIFPDEYMHLGGDEVNPAWWDSNERIQKWMADHHMSDAHALQTWFIKELGDHMRRLDRQPIGWDEVLDAELGQDFVIQAWRGMNARNVAVHAGHATIVSSPYYLDLSLPADYHYSFQPEMSSEQVQSSIDSANADTRLSHVADGLAWQQDFGNFPSTVTRSGGSILGGEGCLWSELVDADTLHTRVWTRMPAIAERFWRGQDALSTEEMYSRLESSLAQLKESRHFPTLMSMPDALQPVALKPLLEQLEPVKWYSRVIGTERLNARVSGQAEAHLPRPYDINTPLNRVVDFIPSESLAARKVLATLQNTEEMADWTAKWREQHETFIDLEPLDPRLDELSELSEGLVKLADIHEDKASIDFRLGEPNGEYLLPIAAPLLHHALLRLAKPWGVEGPVREINRGHINDTFVIGEQLLVQRLNESIFNTQAVLRNRRMLDPYIHDLVPSVIPTEQGGDFVEGFGGETWRAMEFIESRSFDVIPDELCFEAGSAFGGFLSRLRSIEDRPIPVIEGFHDLSTYLADFDSIGHEGDSENLIEYVEAQRGQVIEFPREQFQVIHGDCKVNNLLFDLQEPKVVKVVDLDTVMWGHPAWDFGDLLRSVLTGESDPDQERQRLGEVTSGFATQFNIKPEWVDLFANAPVHMSFMLGVRFLTDHMRGDTYFKVARHGENLERAREQFGLVERFGNYKTELTSRISKSH